MKKMVFFFLFILSFSSCSWWFRHRPKVTTLQDTLPSTPYAVNILYRNKYWKQSSHYTIFEKIIDEVEKVARKKMNWVEKIEYGLQPVKRARFIHKERAREPMNTFLDIAEKYLSGYDLDSSITRIEDLEMLTDYEKNKIKASFKSSLTISGVFKKVQFFSSRQSMQKHCADYNIIITNFGTCYSKDAEAYLDRGERRNRRLNALIGYEIVDRKTKKTLLKAVYGHSVGHSNKVTGRFTFRKLHTQVLRGFFYDVLPRVIPNFHPKKPKSKMKKKPVLIPHMY